MRGESEETAVKALTNLTQETAGEYTVIHANSENALEASAHRIQVQLRLCWLRRCGCVCCGAQHSFC